MSTFGWYVADRYTIDRIFLFTYSLDMVTRVAMVVFGIFSIMTAGDISICNTKRNATFN